MSAKVQLMNVSHIYGQGNVRIEALHLLNLQVERGEFVALMGPSGCGKTTLLNLIGGMDRPSSGKIFINDHVINDFSERQLTKYRRDTVGFIFQFFNLLPTLNVLENVEMPLLLGINGKEVTDRALAVLNDVGLGERLNHYPYQLSGGEAQRVAIARALVHHPNIILADEPSGNLDSGNGNQVMELLRNLCEEENVTVIMATHSESSASFADRIVKLYDGRMES